MKTWMHAVYELAPVIADVIAAHCPGTTARERFVRAYLGGHWREMESMVEGMLAEPWHLRGCQEIRLREFLDLIAERLERASCLGIAR
jgi:hypothetical protein